MTMLEMQIFQPSYAGRINTFWP